MEQIITTAMKLFALNGIRAVTMDRIAREAGVSKRTIYENFEDKNNLLYCAIVEEVTQRKKRFLAQIETSDNIIEALFIIHYSQVKLFKQIHPDFWEDLENHYTIVKERLEQNDTISHKKITYTMLKKGVNEGIFQKGLNIELVNSFIHIMISTFWKDSQINEKYSKKEISCSILFPFFKGICTPKGVALLEDNIAKAQQDNFEF